MPATRAVDVESFDTVRSMPGRNAARRSNAGMTASSLLKESSDALLIARVPRKQLGDDLWIRGRVHNACAHISKPNDRKAPMIARNSLTVDRGDLGVHLGDM